LAVSKTLKNIKYHTVKQSNLGQFKLLFLFWTTENNCLELPRKRKIYSEFLTKF
jgi:hypothetical protein